MPDSNDDAELVRRAQAGSHEAFGLLYDRYARLIRALCYDTTLNLDMAQDLCQEVFMRAYRKLDTLEKPGSIGAWLVSIARNVGREYCRAASRDRHQWRGEPDEILASNDENPAARLEQHELLASVAQLPEDERLAIRLFYLDEQHADRARGVMGLSRSGFYKVLDRAKKHLRESLKTVEVAKP